MLQIFIIAVIACVLASAFFSASEMAYSSNNRIRLENMADEGDVKAKKALKVTDDYDNTLSAILVGNNLVNIAASSLGTLAAIIALGEDYTWVSTLVITIAVIIFGETIPKITAKKNATKYSVSFAGIMRFLTILFRPVTWVVVGLVNLLTMGMKSEEVPDEEAAMEELHSIIDTAEDEDVIDEDSSELISAAIDFADISVSEVMTARVDLTAVDIDDDWDEIMETVLNSSYSRIPVYQDSIDNIIGILSLNRFLKTAVERREFDLREMMMQPYFVYKTTKLPAVLSTLRDSQQHLAVVTDEYGGTLGVVTMEDVLEELVGDIWDETDIVEDEVSEISENKYEIDGDASVSELIELLDLDELEFDYESETVGGWCIEMVDDFPNAGDSFEFMGYTVKILEADERRVNRIEITKNTEEKTEE